MTQLTKEDVKGIIDEALRPIHTKLDQHDDLTKTLARILGVFLLATTFGFLGITTAIATSTSINAGVISAMTLALGALLILAKDPVPTVHKWFKKTTKIE